MNHATNLKRAGRTRLCFGVTVAAIVLFSCGKADPARDAHTEADHGPEGKSIAREELSADRRASATRAPGAPKQQSPASGGQAFFGGQPQDGLIHREKNLEQGRGLRPAFVPPTSPEQRLREYQLQLSYTTTEFMKSRALLLSIAGKRGFLDEASTSLDDRARMHAQFIVRSAELTEVLKELDGLGVLTSERIVSTDFTESYVLQERTAAREEIRARRKAHISTGGLLSKNWSERNASLEASENNLDRALHEQWKLRDRARWARVTVQLLGPETTPAVAVPPYQRALIGLANLALSLSYLLLWLSPVLVLAIVLWLLRRRVEHWLARLRGQQTPA